MPQEISVSYQAIKSKVYRRWWALIHPADRPVAQKYLLMVLGRSASALDSMEDALLSVGPTEPMRTPLVPPGMASKRMRLVERLVKEAGVRSAV